MAESSDKYILREFSQEDYAEYASWWSPENPPPPTSLPRIGLVSGDMKSVGFLANTDTDFAIITWWYANPEIKPRAKYSALKRIIEGLIELSLIIEKKKVFIYTNNRAMIRMLESLGFVNYDGHLVRQNYG